MSKQTRCRLDVLLYETGKVQSRERARALIMAGKVRVNDMPVDKPGMRVSRADTLDVKADLPFVSRGGLKLEAALSVLKPDIRNKICMDVGASTGGFTDCLLQHGAKMVFAVDVGYGQLAWKLRQDPRVILLERTNIRHMQPDRISERIDIATIDVSFISLKIVLPVVKAFMRPGGWIFALIKPQFEVGKEKVGKGGVVRDTALHDEVITTISEFCLEMALKPGKAIPSPILGPKGNREYILPINT